MFSPVSRAAVRDALIEQARSAPQVSAAAILGSGAVGCEDRWSDIDLALRLAPGADRDAAVEAWTRILYDGHDALAHTDVRSGAGLYRVFVLADTLQIDLSFWPHDQFLHPGAEIAVVVGVVEQPGPAAPATAADLLGMAWLHAIHVRSAIARDRPWQAIQMIAGVRDQVVAMACLRHALPIHQGRGVDRLPGAFTDLLPATMPASTSRGDLVAALAAVCGLMLTEAGSIEDGLASRLAPMVEELLNSSRSAP